jgi:hypothetical protein
LASSIVSWFNVHFDKHRSRYTSPLFVFIVCWISAFLLYLIAMRAGKAGSYYAEWLRVIREESFWSYINRPESASLYQFTQFVTYVFYKLFGASPIPWHLLHLSLHVANCTLLYMIFSRLLKATAIRDWWLVAATATFLFCLSPYNSEVVVHEPCFHYTTGFLMLLLPLLWMQYYMENRHWRYPLWSILLYIPATYSLEVFYLTPCAILIVALYYRFALNYDKVAFRRVVLLFTVPMLVVFTLHLLSIRFLRDASLPHGVSPSLQKIITDYLDHAPKYFFHILLLGRFWPHHVRQDVYSLVGSDIGLLVFHISIFGFFAYALIRFRRISKTLKVVALSLILALLFIAIISNREFPSIQYISLDRYVYFSAPFLYLILVALLFSKQIRISIVGLLGLYFLANIYFLLKVNKFWMMSNNVVESLIQSFPDPGNRTVVLLNPPENMHGAVMIRSHDSSCFKVMYNMNHERRLTTPIYEVASYNMLSPDDGVHIKVVNDSMLHVTLNNWGTWWWHNFLGGYGYTTEAFKLNMVDPGHWYELTLTKPIESYLLLYSVGGKWKLVDMSIRDRDQS